jgi:hypothetical protein
MQRATLDDAVDRRTAAPAVPDRIASPRGKLVWMTVATAGTISVQELKRRTGLPSLELFPCLETLTGRSDVRWNDGTVTIVSDESE